MPSSKGNHGTKTEHNTGLLSHIPGPVQFGIMPNVSNISGSSAGGSTAHEAFMAYEKFRDDDCSLNSKRSRVSYASQDTFSTYGGEANCNVWGKACGTFKCQITWPEALVKSRAFKRVSICLILLYTVICAFATVDFVSEDETMKYYSKLVKNIFVWIMSVELGIQFLAHGFSFFSNGWLLFDLFCVCPAWAFPNLLIIRSFRLVRTLRLASWIKDLKSLVMALLSVIPKMFSIFLLLSILFMIFSILFTDLFKHTYKNGITDEDYFGSIPTTLFTLFQIMTLDSWGNICKQIMVVYDWAWAPFIGFVIVSSFFFLNLVIAVVCDAVTSVHRDNVVQYINDDISAVTSVREALKVEGRLGELAGSVHLMMQTQITVLETIQKQQTRHTSVEQANQTHSGEEMLLQKQKEALQQDLKSAQERNASVSKKTSEQDADLSGSVGLNSPAGDENKLRQQYLQAMEVPLDRKQPPHERAQDQDKPLFRNEDGPVNPIFWASIGLSDEQIAKVMQALKEQRIEIVQKPVKR